jgi:hypothetical protein
MGGLDGINCSALAPALDAVAASCSISPVAAALVAIRLARARAVDAHAAALDAGARDLAEALADLASLLATAADALDAAR